MDAEDILAIPLGRNGEKDEIIWNLDSKGIFSVKNAYQFAQTLQGAADASGSSDKANGRWENLWKLNILPRAKICLWRILNNFIPTKVNLIQRGMDPNPWCVFCRKVEETSSHTLWNCKR